MYSDCDKRYGSEDSLNLHIRLKHEHWGQTPLTNRPASNASYNEYNPPRATHQNQLS
jgi:hypothetical protein